MSGPPSSRPGEPPAVAPSLGALVQVPMRTVSPPAVDVSGTDLWGRAVAAEIVTPGRWTLLLFLGSRCDGCLPFWRAADDPGALGLVPGDTVRIVTRDIESEDADAVLAQLAGFDAAALVVMSAAAWRAYGVQGPPFFSLVDGAVVRSEGVAWSVEQVAADVGRVRHGARRAPDGRAEKE